MILDRDWKELMYELADEAIKVRFEMEAEPDKFKHVTLRRQYLIFTGLSTIMAEMSKQERRRKLEEKEKEWVEKRADEVPLEVQSDEEQKLLEDGMLPEGRGLQHDHPQEVRTRSYETFDVQAGD